MAESLLATWTSLTWICLNDAPTHLGLWLQEPATAVGEELVLFHDWICLFLIWTGAGVMWILANIIADRRAIAAKHVSHGSTLEIIWTIIPGLILVAIAVPSFRLLYLLDEIIDPSITVKITGMQWYWRYEFSDFISDKDGESIAFDSFCERDADLPVGGLRLLDVDNRLVLPERTHVRAVITAADVMHCWAVPSLGIRMDAIPGRLNAVSFLVKRTGLYFGICAELCGADHGAMPVVVNTLPQAEFLAWIMEEQGE